MIKKFWTITSALTAFLLLSVGPLLAAPVEVNLVAEKVTLTMPNTGEGIPMWGYRLASEPAGSATVPGPTIRVTAADDLTINLSNNLDQGPGLVEPTSLVIMGQTATETDAMVPTWTDNDTGPRAGDVTKRVRSFTHEAAPGGTATYEWGTDTGTLKPGTYLIQSGTHPAVQVQMGLYAVLVVDDAGAAGTQVYGQVYDSEQMMLFSEIDPALHAAVYADEYGPSKPVTSTMHYDPKYYLLNGEPYTDAGDLAIAGTVGDDILVRFLNAGLRTRVPQVLEGTYLTVLAEDGKAVPFAVDKNSLMLPAAKTFDVLVESSPAASIPVFDRRLAFSKNTFAAVSLSLSSDVQSPQAAGTPVTFSATATGGSEIKEYRFWLRSSTGTWSVVQPYSTNNIWTWDNTGLASATYYIQADVRNIGSSAARDAADVVSFSITSGQEATGVSITAAPVSPQPIGTSVSFTATGSGGSGNYEYRYWLKSSAGTWSVVQAYSTNNVWTWETAGLASDSYYVQVDVRNAGSTVARDAVSVASYFLSSGQVATGVSVVADPTGPQTIGTPVSFTATGSGGSGSYEYRFWLKSSTGTWSITQAYSTNNIWTWDTTGLGAGTYYVQVDVRNVGSLATREASQVVSYRVSPQSATGAALTAAPASPQPAGTSVSFTGTGSGGSGAYEYRFWLKSGGTWSVVQPYSTNDTFIWDTTGLMIDTYNIQLDVRSVGSLADREASQVVSYSVIPQPATGAALAADPASPQPAGTSVTFTGTGGGGSGAYEYRFWLKSGGTWSVVQPYSTNDTFTWDTTGVAADIYNIQLDVRSVGSSATREASDVESYGVQ